MCNSNPFNVSFGQEPNNVITRNNEFSLIRNVFNSENPETKTITITGPRGCGKTVLLSQVKKSFENEAKWIVVDVNPNDNILEQIASSIYEKGKIKHLFLKSEFNFSFSGLGISFSGDEPVSNIYALIDKIMAHLRKKNIKLLIIIDDVSSNSYVKQFAPTYQKLIRDDFNVFLLMTGLYENIYKLERIENLTFLARSTKIQLSSLNIRSITQEYMKIFNIDMPDALKLAKETSGYAYAYQLLGNILFNSNKTKIDDDVLMKYDILLEDNSYSLIWDSLTKNEKALLFAAATSNKINDIIKFSNLSNSSIQVYKKNLEKAGLIDTSIRGTISFSLPRFKEFVSFKKELIEEKIGL